WHIECSAMAYELLGESFDIHGGGLDLQFPHHENEIAQSACAHEHGSFANVWLHNEMLQVEGKKMSKSLGNFFTVRDLLDQGIPGEVIRFVLLSTHYRSPMDWTREKAVEAMATLRTWRRVCGGAEGGAVNQEVMDCLCDDVDTPGAIAHLHRLAKEGKASELLASAGLMGLLTEDLGEWARSETLFGESLTKIREILVLRQQARERKDFALADRIRNALAEFGISIEDMPDGKVKPKTDFLRARSFFASLSEGEKRKAVGNAYDAKTGKADVLAMASAYDLHVARLVLEALK
ncbi:MAG: class I tRNA ligase family protein, partial [Paracoccaceae bacterium]